MNTTTIPWNSAFWGRALETFLKPNVRGSFLKTLTRQQLEDLAKEIILSQRTFPETKITPAEAERFARQDINVFFEECQETIDAGVEILVHSNLEGLCGEIDAWVSNHIPRHDVPEKKYLEDEGEYRERVRRIAEHNKRHNWCLFGVRSLIRLKFQTIYNREV